MTIRSRQTGIGTALIALVSAIAIAIGIGTAPGDARAQGGCSGAQFGERTLKRGDCGNDVRTLNWLFKSKGFEVRLRNSFSKRTERATRSFQRKKGLEADGVVGPRTSDALVRSMRTHIASWYGPGFWGNQTACGQRLRKRTVGVAHRKLPCGTRVVLGHGGRYLRTRVIDRGPYVKRRYERDWDLTRAAARKLNFEGTGKVRAAAIK